MEPTEEKGPAAPEPGDVMNEPAIRPSAVNQRVMPVPAQAGRGTCATCGGAANPDGGEMATYAYVYALGRVEPRIPSLALEKEFAQSVF